MPDLGQAEQIDIHSAATAMAERSKFIRDARKQAGKEGEPIHQPQSKATSRVVDGKEPDSSGGVPQTPQPAASEPAKSGGDSPASPVSNDKPADTPVQTVRVKVGDKDLDMPVDLLGSYIEKAQRAEAAIAEAETLKKVKVTDDAVALTVTNWAKTATPAQMRELQRVLQGQTQRRQEPIAPDLDPDLDDGAPAGSDGIEQLKEELAPALQAIEQLVARENARSSQRQQEDRQANVQTLMGKYEAFKDPGLAGLALRSIKNALAAKPDADVTELVAEHAAEYGNYHRTRKSSNAAAGVMPSATPDPKDPGAASRPALTGKDLKSGAVLAAAMKYLRETASR